MAKTSESESVEGERRSRFSRRSFLRKTAAGAAAVGMAAAAPALSKITSDYAPALAQGVGPNAPRRLVAYVRDAAKGEIAIMIGEREIVVRDFGIVSRLLAAAVR